MNPSIPSMIKSRPANDIKPPRLLMTALVISLFVAATFFATADHTAFAQPSGWPACYLTLDQIDEWGRQLEADHPALVERLEIGPSHCQEMGGCALPDGWWVEGDPIVVLVISNKSAATRKIGRLWLDAAVHPRELSTVPVVRAFAESLVDGYGSDAQITYLLDHFEVHVNPIANPDGRRVVELGAAAGGGGVPWQWRKNVNLAADADCAWPPDRSDHGGVDLNRNHGFMWAPADDLSGPCANPYPGEAPASEAETRAFESYVAALFEDRREDDSESPAPRTLQASPTPFITTESAVLRHCPGHGALSRPRTMRGLKP